MTKLIDIEGIGPVYAKKLQAAGVLSVEGLLKEGATPKGREGLAKKAGIDKGLILEWVNHADLIRIKGIGGEYAELLEAAGVDTVPELAKRKPDNLVAKMLEMNNTKKLVRKMPSLKQVQGWIDQASKLPRVMQY